MHWHSSSIQDCSWPLASDCLCSLRCLSKSETPTHAPAGESRSPPNQDTRNTWPQTIGGPLPRWNSLTIRQKGVEQALSFQQSDLLRCWRNSQALPWHHKEKTSPMGVPPLCLKCVTFYTPTDNLYCSLPFKVVLEVTHYLCLISFRKDMLKYDSEELFATQKRCWPIETRNTIGAPTIMQIQLEPLHWEVRRSYFLCIRVCQTTCMGIQYRAGLKWSSDLMAPFLSTMFLWCQEQFSESNVRYPFQRT